jgi:mannose-6-phosphate isomerase-like protein (cupin superfamily)
MRIEQKVWGERWMVREDSTHTTNILKLKAGYRCSWHRHQCKHNLFALIEGKVMIFMKVGHVMKCVTLSPGDSFTVSPGQWHEFRVLEDGIMVEEMYVQYDDEDIEREKLGGPIGE